MATIINRKIMDKQDFLLYLKYVVKNKETMFGRFENLNHDIFSPETYYTYTKNIRKLIRNNVSSINDKGFIPLWEHILSQKNTTIHYITLDHYFSKEKVDYIIITPTKKFYTNSIIHNIYTNKYTISKYPFIRLQKYETKDIENIRYNLSLWSDWSNDKYRDYEYIRKEIIWNIQKLKIIRFKKSNKYYIKQK